MTTTIPTGVMLLNMGGPQQLSDVEPFLRNLFADREIIRLGPRFLQGFIAGRIARKRAPKSRQNYEKIGGKSPINEITSAQALALEQALRADGDYIVTMGMRYWRPRTPQSLARLVQSGIRRVIALPLYPHYSVATNGSSLIDLRKAIQASTPGLPLEEIPSWPIAPGYIRCLAKRVREGLAQFDGTPVQLVYSAHSLPQKFIDEGDPYLRELQQTIAALEAITGVHGLLCFQSRSGPVKWLEPSTPDTLRQLAGQGCKNILMLPISFVSDHIETLYEVDMLFKEEARQLGMQLKSTKALNDDPEFIQALREVILNRKIGA